MDLGPVGDWLRSSAWIASWLQLAITLAVAAIDLYVVLYVLFRQILAGTTRQERLAMGRGLRDIARDRLAEEAMPGGRDVVSVEEWRDGEWVSVSGGYAIPFPQGARRLTEVPRSSA